MLHTQGRESGVMQRPIAQWVACIDGKQATEAADDTVG